MKSSFINTFPLYKKYLSLAGVSEKRKKSTPLAKKSVSMSKNQVSLKKVATPEFENVQQSSTE